MIRTLLFLTGALLSATAALAQIDSGTTFRSVEVSHASLSRTEKVGMIREVVLPRPKPSTTMAELARSNPNLSQVLPGLPSMMTKAEVSSRFKELYDAKLRTIKTGAYFTKHNYFDCDTILRLRHPSTGQKILLVQADMDNVTDGSDPARSPKLTDYNLARTSDWYLPETSYSWAGKTGTNPFLAYYPKTRSRLAEYRAQFQKEAAADGGVVWREMMKACDAQIYRVEQRGMQGYTKAGLTTRRYLLATKDPFVVLPKGWVLGKEEFSPNIGDYAAVVYGKKIYPAILGDAGPNDKVGEASLRLAKTINPSATGKVRAVNDLGVTYIFFPKSADPRGEPNYEKWHAKVSALVNRIGGLGEGVVLHQWR